MKKIFLSLGLLAILILMASQGTQAQAVWTSRTPATDNNWSSVTYGNGLFVAVSTTGRRNRVMTSPDGITWTSRSTPVFDYNWSSVTYGNGLFVAVASSGAGNRVMTSPDGITWTSRRSAADNFWTSVAYGNGLFVAVANSGTGNRVMTSTDGITWTSRSSAADKLWNSVTCGNGLFVAVASSGAGNRVMTSPDGITWTSRNSAENLDWFSVAYGNGLFVAVTAASVLMTSPDGITWTSNSTAGGSWNSVTYGNGLFVAVSMNGSGQVLNNVMTSPNGITWTSSSSAPQDQWVSVAYGNGLFVAVSRMGGGISVMTSPFCSTPAAPAASDASVCNGSTASLSASGTGSLSWFTAPSGGTKVATGSSFTTPALSSNTTYYVEDSTCAVSATRTAVTVTVNAPVINITGATTICSGFYSDLTASVSIDNVSLPFIDFTWTDGPIGDSYTVYPTTSTTYTVTGVDLTNGCSNTASVLVTVNNCPPTITVTGTLSALSTVYGTASSTGTFTLSVDHFETFAIKAPSGFEIASTQDPNNYRNDFGYDGGVKLDDVVLVRLAANAEYGTHTGRISLATPGGDSVFVAVSGTVSKKALTISGLIANNKVYNGTTAASLSGTATLNGLLNSDVVLLTGTPSAVFVSATVGNAKAVTVTGYMLSGTNASNYTLAQPTGLTANITTIMVTTTTWNGSVWSNGVPTSSTDVIIEGNYSGKDISCKSLTVNTGATLNMVSGKTLTVANGILNNGTIYLLEGGSLLQTGTYTGTGVFKAVKQGRTDASKPQFCGVPVQSLGAYAIGALVNTYQSNMAVLNINARWSVFPSSSLLIAGMGYKAFNAGTISYIGTPNSGNIIVAGVKNVLDPFSTNNLLGNPYPSGLDVAMFLSVNGLDKLWILDITGTWVTTTSGTLGIGQGFMVALNTSKTIYFTNAMRVAANPALLREGEYEDTELNSTLSNAATAAYAYVENDKVHVNGLVSGTEVTLFDARGGEVGTAISNGNTTSMTAPSAGVYIIRAKDANYTGKVVVVR